MTQAADVIEEWHDPDNGWDDPSFDADAAPKEFYFQTLAGGHGPFREVLRHLRPNYVVLF